MVSNSNSEFLSEIKQSINDSLLRSVEPTFQKCLGEIEVRMRQQLNRFLLDFIESNVEIQIDGTVRKSLRVVINGDIS